MRARMQINLPRQIQWYKKHYAFINRQSRKNLILFCSIKSIKYPYSLIENKIFKVVLTKDPDGFYIADIPTLKLCISYGETIEEAMENIQDALHGVLATMQAKRIPIPNDIEPGSKHYLNFTY